MSMLIHNDSMSNRDEHIVDLKQQRDAALARERLLQREFCEAVTCLEYKLFRYGKNTLFVIAKKLAKDRGWDCYEEEGAQKNDGLVSLETCSTCDNYKDQNTFGYCMIYNRVNTPNCPKWEPKND